LEIGVFLLAGAGVALGALHWTNRAGEPLEVRGSVALISGVGLLAFAVLGPLDSVAHRWLWGHMIQHLVLISLAAPLLAMGRQPHLAHMVKRANISVPAWLREPAPAALVLVAVLFLWHTPALYDAAVRNDQLHATEHLTLLAAAVWLWRTLLNGVRDGASVLWLFLVTLPMTGLGVAMTIARTPWYRTYSHSSYTAALQDQQMAGVVMWSFGGLAAAVAGVAMFAVWLNQSDVGGRP
jgi:putative membrane protein